MSFVKAQYEAVVSTRRQWRQFALIWALICLAVAGIMFRHGWQSMVAWLVPAALFGGLAWLAPRWLEPIHRVWMVFAAALGFVMTRVILTAVYYLVLTPVSLLSRVLGKRYLDDGYRDDRTSYWVTRPTTEDRAAAERQY